MTWITGPLARLQLGRAQKMMGDNASARKSYEEFLSIWKDAGPNVPVYRQPKRNTPNSKNKGNQAR
jgi:eukaryotic-like serine/threonine-protein kinase